jgi:hypothetical protein
MDAFGRPNASTDIPCERDRRSSVVQSLHLMNAKVLHSKLASKTGWVEALAAGNLAPDALITELYLGCYGRFPHANELRTASAVFAMEGTSRRHAIEDVLWSLLNTAEFVFNH